jgi:CDP-diacylglycerol--glycerol-3-phosphate 3-phosphatidyltransferase
MWWLSRPLARLRLPPNAITLAGAVLAVCAAVVLRPWAALALVIAAVLCDGLDGAVAVLADRASAGGALLDKVADRIADIAFVVVLWRCGASAALAVFAGLAVLAVETCRELVGGVLRARITAGERPSRVVCVVIACACRLVSGARWPADVCAAVLLALSVVALIQLGSARRAARGRAS